MKAFKILRIPAALLVLLTMLMLPIQAQNADTPDEAPPFENTEGMTVELIYFYLDSEGNEQIAGKAERAIIPAGISAVTVEIQKAYLPEGHTLQDPRDLPLTEDTLTVKIQVAVPADKEESEEDTPTQPEAPSEPAEKPEEKPTEKPENQPDQKPEEKPENPDGNPTEKPQKPAQKPQGKPDPTNPQTGDGRNLPLWMISLVSAGFILMWMAVKKNSAK